MAKWQAKGECMSVGFAWLIRQTSHVVWPCNL